VHDGVALAYEIGHLGPHGLRLGPRPAADLRSLLFGGLQNALHAVGETADHVRLVGARPRCRAGGAGRRLDGARLSRLRALHHRDRLAAHQLQVSTHPRHHALQPRDVLVDLPAVVTAEDDVESWGTNPTRVGRHRRSLPHL
jgi:hypothetical protein